MLRATFPGIRDGVRELLGVQMDALARKFHETHDMAVKDELERCLKSMASSRSRGCLYRDEGQEEMKKLIATLFLAFASGCVSSDIRYRPCHDLGTDMTVSANEYYSQCPMRDRGT